MKEKLDYYISNFLYPVLLGCVILVIAGAIEYHWNYALTYSITTLGLVFILITIETNHPLSQDWKMTKKSFLRDLSYIVFNAPTIAIFKWLFGLLAIWYSQFNRGIFSKSSILLSAIVYLLVFEFFQYWLHRYSHEGKGSLGRFLWRVHIAHHLPDKVYVVMHAVFSPINAFVTVIIIQVPIILLGLPPESVLIATLLIDLQSLISHFNVDIRGGFFNYIFIGTETHRYHHSANVKEAKNFGNTLAIWDLVFGTFFYQPGINPKKLGVENSELYPASNNSIQVILLPFKRN